MNKIFKYKAFIIGFICGFIFDVVVIDYIIDIKGRGICFYREEKYGFPFNYIQKSGLFAESNIFLVGVIVNILITLIFSFLIGLIFQFTWSKISSPSSPLK